MTYGMVSRSIRCEIAHLPSGLLKSPLTVDPRILEQELLGEDDIRPGPGLAIAPSDFRVESEGAFRDVGIVGVAQREPRLDLTGNDVDLVVCQG